MTDHAEYVVFSPEPYAFPGETVVYSPQQGDKSFSCSFHPSMARVHVTSARLVAFRAAQSGSGLTTLAMLSSGLEEYYSMIELDEIDDSRIRDPRP